MSDDGILSWCMPIGWESVLGVDWKHRHEWGWKLISGYLVRLICGVIRRTDLEDVHFDALSDVEIKGVRQTPLNELNSPESSRRPRNLFSAVVHILRATASRFLHACASGYRTSRYNRTYPV